MILQAFMSHSLDIFYWKSCIIIRVLLDTQPKPLMDNQKYHNIKAQLRLPHRNDANTLFLKPLCYV